MNLNDDNFLLPLYTTRLSALYLNQLSYLPGLNRLAPFFIMSALGFLCRSMAQPPFFSIDVLH